MPRSIDELFRPSNLHKVLACPASASREAEYDADPGNVYSHEGTVAHLIAGMALQSPSVPVSAHLGTSVEGVTIAQEMVDAVETYRSYVYSFAPSPGSVVVEKHIDLSMLGMRDGTLDAAVLSGNTLHVFDFKYGMGVLVMPEENPQLQAYAQGLVDAWENLIDDIDKLTVVLHIVQPRIYGGINAWYTDWKELMAFEASVTAGLKAARSSTPRYNAGEHCRYCQARAACSTYKETAVGAIPVEPPKVKTIDLAELADSMGRVALARMWCDAIEAETYERVSAGEHVPGWKLVKGRGARSYHADEVIALAKRKRLPIDDYMPRELRSPAGLEKHLGLQRFVKLEFPTVITTTTGKPSLVPAKDLRPGINPVDGFDDLTDPLYQ